MTLIHLIDWLTGLASFGVKFIGYPTQIRRNHQTRHSDRAGMATTTAAAMVISYTLWVIHGIAHHDPVEIISQGIGVITCGVLLGQALRK